MFKKHGKKTMQLAATGIGLGVASSAMSGISPQGQAAIGKVSGTMPKVGSMIGAGMVMDSIGELQKPLKKMKKGGY